MILHAPPLFPMVPIKHKQPCAQSYLLITTPFSSKVAEHEIQPESFHQLSEAWWCHDTSLAPGQGHHKCFLCLVYIYGIIDKQMWLPAKRLNQQHCLSVARLRKWRERRGRGQPISHSSWDSWMPQLRKGKSSELTINDKTTCDGHNQIVYSHMPLLLNMMDVDLSLLLASVYSPSDRRFQAGLCQFTLFVYFKKEIH